VGSTQKVAENEDIVWEQATISEKVGSTARYPCPAYQRASLERAAVICKVVENRIYEFLRKVLVHDEARIWNKLRHRTFVTVVV
jgi:hypothetical protein